MGKSGKIFPKQISVGSCSIRSQELPKKIPTLKSGKVLRGAPSKFGVFASLAQNAIFAPEGRRDFSNTAKLPQWPYLYTSYEATYVLKCLALDKIAKNRFTPMRLVKIRFWEFSRKVSLLTHMLLHKSYINVAIAVIFS